MSRSLYRLMIWLHPPRFREQFGEEMLCIFDESAPSEASQLLSDCLVSLPRQWLIRSGAWKLAAGLAISSLLLFGWAYSLTRAVSTSLRQGLEWQGRLVGGEPSGRLVGPLDQEEFAREAAETVAILARVRRAEERHKQVHPRSEQPSGLGRTHRNPAKES
jgi:hypothetical protein